MATSFQRRSDIIRSVIEASNWTCTQASAPKRFELHVAGVDLEAWITDDKGLALSVDVTRGWDKTVESAVYDALDRSSSLVATLLLWEWSDLRAACEAAALRPRALAS